MDWITLGIVLFAALIILLFSGLPIAFSMGLAGLIGVWIFIAPDAMVQIANYCWKYGTDPGFSLIPMFILMAELLAVSGAASELFTSAEKWFNRLPGALGASAEVASCLFGACCGTSTGGAAAMGLVATPELLKRGYHPRLATGLVAAGGTLSIIIPPSGILILYGLLVEESIGKLFIAGIVPGVLITLLFILYIVIYAILKPQDAPRLEGVITWKDRFKSLNKVWAFLLVAVIVLGSMYIGICTATEAGAVGAFTSLVLALAYRQLTWAKFGEVLYRTVRVTCFIFFIIFGALTFAYLLTYLRIPQELANLVIANGLSATQFVIALMLLYLVLGFFIEPAGIILLTIPTVSPVLHTLDINLIWLGILLTLTMQVANLTPPVGLNLFVMKSVCPEVSMGDIIRGSIPFALLILVGLAFVIAFPPLATWLPGFMK